MPVTDTEIPQVTQSVLDVVDLHVHFDVAGTRLKAVDGVSFSIARGESVGLVGESGSGKSVTAISILGLVPPPGAIVGGEILFQGEDLVRTDKSTLNHIRGGSIGYIFQDASTALNPMLSIGQHIEESLRHHLGMRGSEARNHAAELLGRVGLPEPRQTLSRFPHELSGGMRQRVMIAIAVSCGPSLIIADEPTTALDVTIQAQILELLASMVDEMNLALLLISHDLAVVARSTSRSLVMYAGRIVESGTTREVFGTPQHPYTAGLLKSIPHIEDDGSTELVPIKGAPPDPLLPWVGCSFEPRCGYAIETCRMSDPDLESSDSMQEAACWVKPWRPND